MITKLQIMEFRKGKIIFCLFLLLMFGCLEARPLRDKTEKVQDNQGSKNVDHPVTLTINDKYAIMNNGIVQVTLSIPGGHVAEIQYGGVRNVLDRSHKETSRGYWDVFWKTQDSQGEDWLHMENFTVITQDDNKVELSFSTQWNGDSNTIPLNLDKRFVMLRGSSGVYNYLILDHEEGFPAMNISQIRVAFKLQMDKFKYMAISDDIQKFMPMVQDIQNGQPLAYREAILWTNHTDSTSNTSVEDKYQYSEDMKDQQVHGWISSHDPPIGFWLIKASTEFYSAGPFKQELTSHMGPVSLIDFFSGHYAGQNLQLTLEDGESWQKVIGPYLVYLNKASNLEDPYAQLWNNAKDQMNEETKKWPYDFPSSEFYAKANQRGSVGGQLLVRDGDMNNDGPVPASSAWVGLAAPGEEGSWQTETKGYQFWAQADNDGNFKINGVHEGEYSLYAWVPGFIGEFVYNTNVRVQPGNQSDLAQIVYEPLRNGPTLWEIGYPDRTAVEFFVPDPRPEYVNLVFVNSEKNKFRQYGLWERYTDLYPNEDLVYNVSANNYTKDWFFAHVPRRVGDNDFQPSTWQVQFPLQNVDPYGSYTLRIALASASTAQLQVRFNNFNPFSRPQFTTSRIGFDNAIARHGIHGLYWMFSFDVSGSLLQNGMNTLYLTQRIAANPFCGVMYDYLRLEGPSS